MERQNILLERQDRIWTLTFNRPEKRNALDAQTVAEAHDALAEVEREAGSAGAVVVVRGAGDKAFVSGADIGQLHQRTQHDALVAINQGLFTAVEGFPWPTIAAVNGYALGGGFELALSCDLRVASETARFGFPETGLGIIPGAGGTQRLPRLIGAARAKDIVYSGRFVGAEEALAIGLVDRVVAPDDVYSAAVEMVSRYVNGPALALRAAKAAIDGGLDGDLASGLRLETQLFTGLFATEDRTVGMTSFVENGPGKAQFSGR